MQCTVQLTGNKCSYRQLLPDSSFNTVLHCTALYYTTLHGPALHYTTLHCTALLKTEHKCIAQLHHTALYYTVLHCTAMNYTAPHCPELWCTSLHQSPYHEQYTNQLGAKEGMQLPAGKVKYCCWASATQHFGPRKVQTPEFDQL